MSDVVWSAKTDPGLRDRLQALVDASGLTAKDFLARMVDCYEVARNRESGGHVKEIQSLRHHVARIEEIYVSLAKAAQDQREADALRITQLSTEVTQAKATAQDATEKAAKTLVEATAQIERIQVDANARLEDVQAEAARLHEAAQKEVREAREAVARAREAQDQAVKLASFAEETAAAAKARCAELEDLAAQVQAYRQEATQAREHAKGAENALAQALEQANVEKERSAERATLAQERAVLEARAEGIKIREELAQLRGDLARVTMEKAALEFQVGKNIPEKPATSTGKKGLDGAPDSK